MAVQTTVINMLGGSGIGKSTTAAGLYYHMKLSHKNVELVREYVKLLAWQGIKPGQYDQVNIFGEQCKLEHSLYGKVDYIITDSPIILAPVYEHFYHGDSIIEEAAIKFLQKSKLDGIKQMNLLLSRSNTYDTNGRFQTLQEAMVVDNMVKDFLNKYNMDYIEVDVSEIERVNKILRLIEG